VLIQRTEDPESLLIRCVVGLLTILVPLLVGAYANRDFFATLASLVDPIFSWSALYWIIWFIIWDALFLITKIPVFAFGWRGLDAIAYIFLFICYFPPLILVLYVGTALVAPMIRIATADLFSAILFSLVIVSLCAWYYSEKHPKKWKRFLQDVKKRVQAIRKRISEKATGQ